MATYTFELSLLKQIPSGGSLILDFGSFDLTQTAPLNSGLECGAPYGFGLNPAVCTITAQNKLTIKGAFPTQDNLLIFSIKDIRNPSYVNDFPVVISSLDISSSLIEQSGPTAIKFQTQPGKIVTKLTNLGSDVVGEMTDLQLEFTVDNRLAVTDYLQLSTPKWNPGTQSRTSVASMFKVD